MVQERLGRVERRLSAILAADVAGYSRLMHHDEEATHARLTALLMEAVQPAIAEHDGRIVKNTGDGFLAEFASAVEAVRAAMQFQTRIHEITIDDAENNRIAFRVGINIGDVIVEPHDIFGDGVNIAARLESIAEPGGICISSSAYDQVLGKILVEFADLGEQHLKNIARPVRAYALVQQRSGAKSSNSMLASVVGPAVRSGDTKKTLAQAGPSAAELFSKIAKPDLMDGEQDSRMLLSSNDPRSHLIVGRTAPLEMLDRMTQRMLTGQRQIAFVTGEAGIGKTAFIEMAVERLSHQGVDLLCGRCTERFGTDEAFLPLIDALATRCRTTGGVELLAAIRAHAPTWMLQMPGFMDATERAAFQLEAFGATRERMLREFCDLVEALSASRPWVIVLEDIHWSDFATLDVLSRFARGSGGASVLVLGSYRPADSATSGHPIWRLHQDLEIHGHCTELRLDRLSRVEVERYLALRFRDDELASKLSGPVFERTQGQPLFIASLLKYFIDERAIVKIDGAWRLSSESVISRDDVPGDLMNMITHQVGRLTEEERRLLDVASVAGGEFSAALVAAGLSQDAVEAERDLEALVRKDHTLVPSGVSEWPDGTYSGSYAFHHILYQNVIYQRLAPGQRVQTHRRLAVRLEEAYRDRTSEIATVLALHFELGRDFPSALRYLGQAAESSAKRLGHAEAASYLTRALGILDRFDVPDRLAARVALLRPRSLALRSCGDLAGSVRDLRELIAGARQVGKLRQEVNGLLAVSQFCLYADRRVCLQATEDALARSQALEDGTFKALVQGSSASINLYLKGWQEQDAAFCVKAIELTAGAQDHGTLMRRYGIEGILDCWRSRYQECRRSGTQGKRLAREAGDIFVFVLFNVLESTALLHLGEWRELQRETTTALEFAEKNANDPASALCHLTLAWLHVEAMDFDGARSLCECIDDKILKENQMAYFFQRAVLAKAFMGLGEPQRARKQFDDVWRRMDEDSVPMDFTISTQLYHCLGEYCLQTGEIDQAWKWAIQLRDYATPAPDHNHSALAHGLLARIAFAAGDRDEARAELSRALSIVDSAVFPLAAWRVYQGAVDIFQNIGEADRAAEYRNRFATVLRTLARNFEPDDPLHKSLLTALARRTARWDVVTSVRPSGTSE
jgi:class 3 adenylate cyclase/tetratricopeptide (TPR) repeat protein